MSFKSQISDFRFQISNLRSQISNCTFLLLTFAAVSLAAATDPPPSSDGQPREGLNSQAGDDYDRALLGDPATNPSDKRNGASSDREFPKGSPLDSKHSDKGRVDNEMLKRLQRELGAAAQKEGGSENPLVQVAEAMREVPQRLDHRDSGPVTQTLQRQIVSDLDKLIEEAKKSGRFTGTKVSVGNPTGSGNPKAAIPGEGPGKSRSPSQVSTPEIRKAEEIRAAEETKAHERMIQRFRAELQGRKGEQVLAEPSESFLPEYELEIEDYFRRLSEDRPDSGRR